VGSYYIHYFRDKNAVAPNRQYTVEGVGLDYVPKTMDFSHIDDVIEVSDKEAYAAARKLTRVEGIFTGGSTGMTLAGATKWVKLNTPPSNALPVVFLCDVGDRYLSKMYNDDWMREKGYVDRSGLTARDLVAGREPSALITVTVNDPVGTAWQLMSGHDVSQIPVTDGGRVVGAISEARLFAAMVRDPKVRDAEVGAIMEPAFPFVDISTSVDALAAMLTPESPAVLVRDFKTDATFIITRSDVIAALRLA
jgi:cystathionine beta-synthase